MKKLQRWSVVLVLGVLLAACGGDKAKESASAQAPAVVKGGKLFIYNWTYYIPDEVVQAFEKEYGASVVYDVFASNEEMFAKLKAGGSGYDITFPSGDYVSIMISEGMLEKIDKTKVPNFSHIDGDALSKIAFDKGSEYSVPYMMGAAGIAVNKKAVGNFDKSWNIFGRKDLKSRMTMLDDMREVLGAALKSLGYSVNSRNPDELQKAKKVVQAWRDTIMKFDAESFAKGFAAEEFFVVQGYAENVFLELDESKKGDVAFFIPLEGGPMYMDSMVILKDSKNKDLAYKFIDFIHRPEIYAQVADYLMLPSINVKARELTKVKPNYSYEDLKNCEFKEDLGADVELYNKIWQEIRVGS
jgi:spermidine/putrescine transport system substrate-binding protein